VVFSQNMLSALPSKSENELSVQERARSNAEMLDTGLNQLGDSLAEYEVHVIPLGNVIKGRCAVKLPGWVRVHWCHGNHAIELTGRD
jgi:hypothetical protein